MSNSVNLREYIEKISYNKSQTYNKGEVDYEIENLKLLEIVQELPTENIRRNKIYLLANQENISRNKYDLFIYANDDWEQIDSLEFDIGDYYNKNELDYKFSLKADVNHGHDNVSTTYDGFMSSTDKVKLDGIEAQATRNLPSNDNPLMDGTASSGTHKDYSRKDHIHPTDTSRADVGHGHGNITNEGKVGTTANKPLITTTNGSVTTGSFEGTATNIKMNGVQSVGTRNTFARGDHIHPTDTSRASLDTATQTSNGLMSKEDKIRLDGMEDEANHYVHPSYTSKSNGLYKITVDGTGHVSATASVSANDLPSHTHNTGQVSDTSAYTNIGSSANATQKTINDKINTQIGLKANSSDVYTKSQTMTSSEILSAIAEGVSNLELIEVVNTLPTTNIKTNKIYLKPNNENPSINENLYDLYVRVNNKWEQIDSLEFNIDDYYTKTQADNLLANKVDNTDSRLTDSRTPKSHSHGNITNTGAVGNESGKPLITTNNGVVTTGSFGTTSGTFVEGNDSRLSDARTPTSHNHGNITNEGKIGSTANKPVITGTGGAVTTGNFESNTSNIKMNGSVSVGSSNNFARSDHIHPSDTTKIDTAGTGLTKNNTTLNHSNSIQTQSTPVFRKISYDSEGHITGTTNVTASDLPTGISTNNITGLSTVATSGSYSDLTNKPSYTPTITSSTTDSYKIGSLNINGSNVDVYGKDSNTTNVLNNTANITAGESLSSYWLVGGKSDGKHYKLTNGLVLDLRHPILYIRSSMGANSVSIDTYTVFNEVTVANTVPNITLSNNQRAFIEGDYYNNGQFTISNNVIVTNDNLTAGKYYIPIGTTTNATGKLRFNCFNNIVYYFDGNNLYSFSDAIDGEYIEGTQTASTGAWTGVCKHLNQLVKGTKIYYKLPYAGNGNATLNLTLQDGTTTGAINCYYSNTTRLSTQYGVNNIIELVYDGDYWRVANPYTNTNYYERIAQSGQITMGEATAMNVIVGGKTDGNYYKIVSGGVYDIRYQLYWTGGAFAINSVNNNIYSVYNNVNLQSTVSGLTVTNGKRIYIECSHYVDGQYIVSDRVFVSDDNLRTDYYYIPIGMSHSTTNIRFNTFTTNVYVYKEYGLVPYSEALPTPYIDQDYCLSLDYNENILNNPNLLGMVNGTTTLPALTYNEGVYNYTRSNGDGYGYHKIPITDLHEDFILKMIGKVNNTNMSDLGFVLADETNNSYEYFNLRPGYSTQMMRYTHCTNGSPGYTHIVNQSVTGLFSANTWYELVLTKTGNSYTWEAFDLNGTLIKSISTSINNVNIEFIGISTGWQKLDMSVKDITIINL